MGLFDSLFNKNQQAQSQAASVSSYFKTMTAYAPTFTSYEGGIYEMELTRAAVDRFAIF